MPNHMIKNIEERIVMIINKIPSPPKLENIKKLTKILMKATTYQFENLFDFHM